MRIDWLRGAGGEDSGFGGFTATQPLAFHQLSCGCPGCVSKLFEATAPGTDSSAQSNDPGGPQEVSEPTDQIPGNTSTPFTLAIGGSDTGVVNTVGDDDWFRIELVAGQSYAFSMTGNGGTPLTDSFLELYNSAGVLIAVDDDGGAASDSLMRFTATETGTYYLNARAFEDPSVSNTGGYTVSAALGPPQNPLETITHGYVFPDSTISVYFATSGETHSGDTAARSWTQTEIDAVMLALDTIEAVTPLVFTQTLSEPSADFVLTLANLDPNVLGHFFIGVGHGAFSPSVTSWTTAGLAPGGQASATVIHEILHGLGLSHPHLDGLDVQVMQGVIDPFNSYGTFNMNHSVFTIMSYNDGWAQGNVGGPTDTAGNQGTPAPLDVAYLQQIYGVNPTTNSGNDVYTLNAAVTSFRTIWDTAGVDTIQTTGATASTIDLRPATLQSEIGGGGFVSFINGARTGYTIAAGVVIENATGSVGNDVIHGNEGANTLTGNNGNDDLFGHGGNDILIGGVGGDEFDGGDGIDTVSYESAPAAVTVNLNTGVGSGAGSHSAGDSYANVENITGSNSNDTLTGNGGVNGIFGAGGNDTIVGGAGADSIDGGVGADTLSGGADNDFYIVDDAGDTVNENADEGVDTVQAAVSFVLAANIENLVVSQGDINGTGNALNNLITGGDGANVLDGGAGGDLMAGGDGNDTYVVDNFGDVVSELADEGTDLVQTSVNYALGANVENLQLLGSANLNAAGNGLNNTMAGNAGNNVLNGGAGADSMTGAGGNDTFVVDNAGDTVTEANPSGGTDTINASISYTLVGTGYVENLLLTGSADINGTGNFNFNRIWGNSGVNVLNGAGGDDILDGGTGADTMLGGQGNDYFYVDNAGDVVTELSGEGVDTLQANVSFTLVANVENMVLGTNNDINATGNGLNNRINANIGNNTIDGGAGADQMFGGLGNDAYVVDNAGDTVSEGSAGGGVDLVLASVTYTLVGTGYAENLTLTGSADLNATGNFLNNALTGNDGANALSGGTGSDTLNGGLGADTLTGGAHNDAFVFSSALGGGNVDAITDFAVVDDVMHLSTGVFGIAAGTLAASAFVIGAAAADADDRIVYDSATGALYYDADGDGAGAAAQFATLATGLALTNLDFFGINP